MPRQVKKMEDNWSTKDPNTDQPFLLQLNEEDVALIRTNFTDVGRRSHPKNMTSTLSGSPIPEKTDAGTQTQSLYTDSSTASAPSSADRFPDLNKKRRQDDKNSDDKPEDKLDGSPISITYCRVTDGNISLNQTHNGSRAESSTHSHAYPHGSMVMRGLTIVGMVGVSCLVWMSQVKPGAH
ncbi:hypothetical protein NPX13_g6512 [Xylaria arbuscula]|uniref:Uncharacterized protein n=1 Tax=Xylaria arbuscula TaxID=114810 RepID=A0A9W8TKC2_9PEZI|nr:hypothetical protein NPX13_g6512 [Xylaria arbuscula]